MEGGDFKLSRCEQVGAILGLDGWLRSNGQSEFLLMN